MTGDEMYAFAGELFPLARSLTGAPNRKTLDMLAAKLPGLRRYAVPSGSKVYDWTVPHEWNVRGAVLDGPDGRVCSFNDHPLHLLGYSQPHQGVYDLHELRDHLYTHEVGIPYVTSYYEPRWGFCLAQDVYDSLADGHYEVAIDVECDPHGSLDYAELFIPGKTEQEVLFSTYICHPHMANDNTSGMVVQTALAEWIASTDRRYTYRFAFVPETIGALVYLAHHNRLAHMQQHTVAAFVLSCIGNPAHNSAVRSRYGDTLADRIGSVWALNHTYGWMDRGSDERQYGSPLANLPVNCLSRSRWGTFPEYHTSADDMSVITPDALGGSLRMLQRCVEVLEGNGRFRARFVGDAQLGDRGLYPTLGHGVRDKRYQHVLSYCDGELDALDIAQRTGIPAPEVVGILDTLHGHRLVEAA